ncbi:MAG: hypothetical protein LBM77_05610 [Spirochaetaceae bacterium]|nr:hypothetical protein [Spirochaetaceae bacterium]
MQKLIIGQEYRKSDFGIKGWAIMKASHCVSDNTFLDFYSPGKLCDDIIYDDRFTKDGYEIELHHPTDWDAHLYPIGHEYHKNMYIFMRDGALVDKLERSLPFVYIGFSNRQILTEKGDYPQTRSRIVHLFDNRLLTNKIKQQFQAYSLWDYSPLEKIR